MLSRQDHGLALRLALLRAQCRQPLPEESLLHSRSIHAFCVNSRALPPMQAVPSTYIFREIPMLNVLVAASLLQHATIPEHALRDKFFLRADMLLLIRDNPSRGQQ